jgi:nuclear cap-binding protein subunit 1
MFMQNVSDVHTVPDKTDISGSLIRDALVDTINILDFSRNAVAKFLVDMDFFWAPNTFAKRGTSMDKLKNLPEGMSTWKPEDMVIDAIFSQIFYLPSPEHKLVYYHSVTTEVCKLSPGTIAPCLGRAMRFLYRRTDDMDMDLSYRFMDWFAHHLSNFEFRWKWDEWQENLSDSGLHPKKAFIIGAIDKEIRLSFAKRIRETLPKSYHSLIPEEKEKDTPDFKYTTGKKCKYCRNFFCAHRDTLDHPYTAEGSEILQLLRKKAPEDEVQSAIQRMQDRARENGDDPVMEATDAYVTAICYIGSKSLSHVLSYIERCKEHLESIVQQSAAARRQIVASVVAYWDAMPGTAVNIVDKLLNYNIVTPASVIEWALGTGGTGLAEHWRYEMVSSTMGKVTNRANQLALTLVQNPDMSDDIRAKLKATLEEDREKMFVLFREIEEAMGPLASEPAAAFKDEELDEEERRLVRDWAKRWQHVFESRRTVEVALVSTEAVAARVEVAKLELKYRAQVEAEEKAKWEAEKARREAEEKANREAEENASKGQQNGDFVHDALDTALDVA